MLSWQPHDQAETPGVLEHQAAEAQEEGRRWTAANSVPIVTRTLSPLLSVTGTAVGEAFEWLPKIHNTPVSEGD